jgi:hypothetical protein
MDMPAQLRDKLRRYLMNADPFLWGVLEKRNKKERLQEVRGLGFLRSYSEGSNPTYSKVNQDLLVELGIEGILERIVLAKLRARIPKEVLATFRRYWEQGQTPDKGYLKDNRLYRVRHVVWREEKEPREPAHIFLEIDTDKDFVERWTVFAGLWFEEIEPWLEEQAR